MRFADRLQQRIEKTGSRLCVGLDPRPGDGGAAFARNFLMQVIEETSIWAAAFKPNMAYFEAMGIDGIRLLEDLLAAIPKEVPVILDAKRSDIGETQKYYAQGYFAGWNVDAVTLNPFLGYDSIEPFLDWEGKGVYLLAVTSNAGSADFQRQKLADGRSVFELVTALGERAKSEDRATDVGYVVGLTNAADVLEKIPDAPVLVPGLAVLRTSSTFRAASSMPPMTGVSGRERGTGRKRSPRPTANEFEFFLQACDSSSRINALCTMTSPHP